MAEDIETMREPLAQLERELIEAYLLQAGHEYTALLKRHDDESSRLLAEASTYASARLGEMESRAHFVHHLRGES